MKNTYFQYVATKDLQNKASFSTKDCEAVIALWEIFIFATELIAAVMLVFSGGYEAGSKISGVPSTDNIDTNQQVLHSDT